MFMNPSMGMEAKYDPDGVRVYKHRIWNLSSYWHKYIVDTAGPLPKILLVLDANDSNAILKTYIHANDQVIAQHDGDVNSPRYFYLHDRLGSVRQIINSAATVENCYYYTPWGGTTGSETDENVSNWFGWAGYLGDEEISSYYCNARQYNSARFTTRDPVKGTRKAPPTLHAYLYCLNDPINRTDPTGLVSFGGVLSAMNTGAQIYGYVDTFMTVKGYAQRIISGASLSSVMLDAALRIGMNYGFSKALDVVVDAAGPAVSKLAGRVGKRGGHHAIPKCAGGLDDQFLHYWDDLLTSSGHISELEPLIKKRMRDKFGLKIGGWGGGYKDILVEFADNPKLQGDVFQELLDIYADFDIEKGTGLVEHFLKSFGAGMYERH